MRGERKDVDLPLARLNNAVTREVTKYSSRELFSNHIVYSGSK